MAKVNLKRTCGTLTLESTKPCWNRTRVVDGPYLYETHLG